MMSSVDDVQAEQVSPPTTAPPTAVMSPFAILMKLKEPHSATASHVPLSVSQELALYLGDTTISAAGGEWNPLEFWRRNELKYKRLSKIALQVLAATATTAGVERVFSKAEILLSSRRLGTGDDLFEKRPIMSVNHSFSSKGFYAPLKRTSVDVDLE